MNGPSTNRPPAALAASADFDAVMLGRKSIRSFLPKPVPVELLRDLLRVAGAAPSNSNTQPWQVHALAGAEKEALSDAIMKAHALNDAAPLAHFPDPLPGSFAVHQDDFGKRYYQALGIDRADAAGRAAQSARNFSFFNAPVGLIITLDEALRPHSWLDCGLFVQNVMLAATARGLATCPHVSFARYSRVICDTLSAPPGRLVVCGMSLGYPDEAAAVNHLAMPRQPVDSFATFAGFEASQS